MWLEEYVKCVGIATDYPRFNGAEKIYVDIDATDLFLAQYCNGSFNAVDIVVKFLAIENYYNKNDFGLEMYRKMQLKRVGEDWNERFIDLMKSFENGIDMESWINTDLSYSIHDGAHRLALALYHNYKYVPIKVFNVEVKRRYYGMNWFKENGFSETEISIINAKLEELLDMCRKPYYCILWPPARYQYENVINCIEVAECGIHIVNKFKIRFTGDDLKKFIYEIYETDDILMYKLDLKYQHMMRSMEKDNYKEMFYVVYVIQVKFDNPDFRLKPLSGLPQSSSSMRVKKKVRDMFNRKITDYYYDIIMHLTDNQLQNDAVKKIIENAKK